MTESLARRLFDLVEPVAIVTYMADEPTEAVMALGLRNVWAAYFAGRAAPLGRDVPAAVVHALFYNFADGEVSRHIPGVWETVTPEAASAARQRGSVAALRRILGDLADTPGVARAGDLLIEAGTSARMEGRALYAAVRTLPLPTEPLARLCTGPTCCANTAATATSPPSSARASAAPRRTCCTRSRRACPPRASAGCLTCPEPS